MFEALPKNAKVWIYQSNKPLGDDEVQAIEPQLKEFIDNWSSHSRKVMADGKLLYNRFLVLAADETMFTVSGCSIDSSVKFVKSLEQQFNIDFFDRFNIAYKKGEEIASATRKEFQQLIEKGQVDDQTIVFNNLAATVEELETKWQIPLQDSWHAKVFALPRTL